MICQNHYKYCNKIVYSDFGIVLYRAHCYVDFMSYYYHLTSV